MSNVLNMVYRTARSLALMTAAATLAVGASLAVSSSASATLFNYALRDHPGGTLVNPTYGLRLDGLYGSIYNDFTFSFDRNGANMSLVYDQNANTIRISGTAYGGIDTGND